MESTLKKAPVFSFEPSSICKWKKISGLFLFYESCGLKVSFFDLEVCLSNVMFWVFNIVG